MIRILLVDDHKIVREGLRAILQEKEDVDVIADASNGRQAVSLARTEKPDVVIMDISMPGLNGIEATRQIVAECPQTKVIALSMHADRRSVRKTLRAGACAYVLKECATEQLLVALPAILDGQIYLCPRIERVVVGDYVRQMEHPAEVPPAKLSAREREVLQLLAEGHSTRSIAETLHVSVKTVETHRKHIMDKTNLRTLPELTKYALREGLTSLDN